MISFFLFRRRDHILIFISNYLIQTRLRGCTGQKRMRVVGGDGRKLAREQSWLTQGKNVFILCPPGFSCL